LEFRPCLKQLAANGNELVDWLRDKLKGRQREKISLSITSQTFKVDVYDKAFNLLAKRVRGGANGHSISRYPGDR